MSRRDYERAAKLIREHDYGEHETLALIFAEFFSVDAGFDRERFFRACGVGFGGSQAPPSCGLTCGPDGCPGCWHAKKIRRAK